MFIWNEMNKMRIENTRCEHILRDIYSVKKQPVFWHHPETHFQSNANINDTKEIDHINHKTATIPILYFQDMETRKAGQNKISIVTVQ